MSTTSSSSAPYSDLPQQEAFMKSANAYNAVYAKEQETKATLESEMSSMDSWAGLIVFLGTLSALAEWTEATQICTESCASSLAGVMQGAEGIFTDGINYITELSSANGAAIPSLEEEYGSDGIDLSGIPIVDVSTLNSEYSTQVANANLFIEYLSDICWDVSGAAFTSNNPLASISSSIEDSVQDIMYQMVSTFNGMYNNITERPWVLSPTQTDYNYNPSSSNTTSSGTYEANGNGGDYVNDTTDYTDSGGTSPLNGASAADVVCYAMLDWFYVYASPVSYSSGVTSDTVYAPEMSQNPDAYQAATDFQSVTSNTMGVGQQVLPAIAFLSNLDKNALSTLYNAFKTQASVIKDIIANSRGG